MDQRRLLWCLGLLLQLFAFNSLSAANDPTRWQADIDAFLAADQQAPSDPGGIVFVGSSSIRMWNLPESFPELAALNRGFGGSEIADSTHYFTELVGKHEPRLVVFYAGDNDVANGNSAERVHEDFVAFAEKFKLLLPDAQLVYLAIKPSIARWSMAETMQAANARIAADCAVEDRFTFVDVWPVMLGSDGKPRADIFLEDGLHMNQTGYALWADLLREPLTKTSKAEQIPATSGSSR